MVVEDFKIERVLIDQGSSANILYGSTYRRMGLLGLKETPGCLYGFSGERVPIKGTVELDTNFGEGGNAKMIPVLYTVIEAEASYNIIMGRPALNRLKAIVSTYHLCMKYPTTEGVGAVWADSSMAKRCYQDSLKVGQRRSAINTLSLKLDPRCHDERERPHGGRQCSSLKEPIFLHYNFSLLYLSPNNSCPITRLSNQEDPVHLSVLPPGRTDRHVCPSLQPAEL
ncbi:hypothetical protein CR513_41620, partial [Mucuna pruriens]